MAPVDLFLPCEAAHQSSWRLLAEIWVLSLHAYGEAVYSDKVLCCIYIHGLHMLHYSTSGDAEPFYHFQRSSKALAIIVRSYQTYLLPNLLYTSI